MNDKPHFPLMMSVFESSLPSELEILRRLERARERRERRRRKGGLRPALSLAAAALCLTGIALFFAGGPHPEPRVTAETRVSLPRPEAKEPVPVPVQKPQRPATAEPPATAALPARSPRVQPKLHQEPIPPAPADSNVPSWSQLATALRSGNREEADVLVAGLTESDDLETRQSAVLYQIREKLRQNPEALATEDRAILQNLASTGVTASIRLDAKKHLTDANAVLDRPSRGDSR